MFGKEKENGPHETLFTKVVCKRFEIMGEHTMTIHYVTFEVKETGQRLQFPVSGFDYGFVVEGDEGTLEFQGNKFIKFERIIN